MQPNSKCSKTFKNSYTTEYIKAIESYPTAEAVIGISFKEILTGKILICNTTWKLSNSKIGLINIHNNERCHVRQWNQVFEIPSRFKRRCIALIQRSLLNCVTYVLKTCSRANVPCVLTCSRANLPYVLMCLASLPAHVLTCLARLCVLRPYLLTCQRVLRAYVLMWQRASFDATIFSSLPLLLKLYTLLVRFKSLVIVFPQ